ncbi:putative acetylglutamate kinase [Helianthus annuus]|nr:putative acetylglutamate kinase [Helianthus annuus]
MEIVSMVLVGRVNKHLVGLINKVGATAVGLCGTDGRIFTAVLCWRNCECGTGELAAALGAEKLLLTDVAGILEDKDDPGVWLKRLVWVDDWQIAGGMIPKVSCCVKALGKGVKTASIIDGWLDQSLLLEIHTDEGAGTMITG